ncbi:MAG TPA: hypothetical protein VKA57_06055 [Solirubrobacteraceae bacterium]|nr:hypothetical protein [Solirubrobacteraceae bacterium]
MSEEIEDRLRLAGAGLRPTPEAEERALRAALAQLRERTSPVRKRGRPARWKLAAAAALSAVAVGLGVVALLPGGSSSPPVVAVDGGSDRFPSESLTDWASYADQVSIVTVVGERALPAEVIEAGDRYVPRAVTLRVEDTIWRREGAPRAGDAVRVNTFGWSLQDGERRPVTAWGGPRLELGSRYVAPLVRAPRDGAEWTPLALGATLPLEGDVMATSGIVGAPSPLAKSMSGKAPTTLADALARTAPDPIAAKHFDLPPDERWRAVLRERESR